MTKHNWQKIWAEHNISIQDDKKRLESELLTIRWREMEALIKKHFGSFQKIKTIEIGAGLGDFSLLLSWQGADTTLADYSEEAIRKARARFKAHRATANFVKADMLKVDQSIIGKFDISFSLGLAEHFKDQERYKIIQAHAKVLRKGGLTFISVPYRYSFLYRIWMARSIKRGDWQYGLEIPFSKKEIKTLAEQAGLVTIGFIQSSLWADWQEFFPKFRIKKFLGWKINKKSIFDKFGYALVYVGEK